jgi:hypothetical protein
MGRPKQSRTWEYHIGAWEKARKSIQERVSTIYMNPPILANRYPTIHQMPLADRLKKATSQLSDWLHRLDSDCAAVNYIQNRVFLLQTSLVQH